MLHPLDWSDIEQWMQAEHNAFFMCDKFEKPQWVELLFFHEYGRRVGMVSSSSLKGGKNSLMVVTMQFSTQQKRHRTALTSIVSLQGGP